MRTTGNFRASRFPSASSKMMIAKPMTKYKKISGKLRSESMKE